ncbi:unnamed protein product [Colias eurytheme]|nr:unnamed protein product [Colias eurytheme]
MVTLYVITKAECRLTERAPRLTLASILAVAAQRPAPARAARPAHAPRQCAPYAPGMLHYPILQTRHTTHASPVAPVSELAS